MATLLIVGLAPIITAIAAEDAAKQKEPVEVKDTEAYTGELESFDAEAGTITVKKTLYSKTFHFGEGCQIILETQPEATANDLRKGEWTKVEYREVGNVLIATKLTQVLSTLEGSITAIDPERGTIRLDAVLLSLDLKVAEDAEITLRTGEPGKLADLQIGQRVTVKRANAEGVDIARSIEQTGRKVSGRLHAVDLSSEIIRIRTLLRVQTFQAGGECKVVIDNTLAELKDLVLGGQATVTYSTEKGVLVAHSITQQPETLASTESK